MKLSLVFMGLQYTKIKVLKMTKEEAYNYIEEINKAGSVLGLDSMYELLLRLDNPQEKLHIVHVAGTNGKGSVCAFLEEILLDAGYRVGRYVSPTIFSYFERFQINKSYISDEDFAKMLDIVKRASDGMVADGYARPTAFETETAVSFLYFLDKNVDIVLLETGMGGLEDATNVCKKPLCTILTSISMDHMQFLGDSIYDILNAKLGILKQNVPCVSDIMEERLKKIWLDKCEEMKCPHIMTDIEQIIVMENDEYGIQYTYKGKTYLISMLGKHQINNSILAIEAAQILREYGYDLDYVNVKNGLRNTNWKGRFQKLSDRPLLYVDGAHNEGGWNSLKDNIETYLKGKKLISVCGVLKDKEYQKMLHILSPYTDCFIAVTPDSPRALPKEVLLKYAAECIENTYGCELDEALDKACEIAETLENSAVLVYGSLSFIGPVIEKYEMKADRINAIFNNHEYRSYMKRINENEKTRRFCCHGMAHCLDVARIAYIINLEEGFGIPKDILYAAALLHDIGRADDEYTGKKHNEKSRIYCEPILYACGYHTDEVKMIAEAIEKHNTDCDKRTGLVYLLYKADKLSRNCFDCDMYRECYWKEDMKNNKIRF